VQFVRNGLIRTQERSRKKYLGRLTYQFCFAKARRKYQSKICIAKAGRIVTKQKSSTEKNKIWVRLRPRWFPPEYATMQDYSIQKYCYRLSPPIDCECRLSFSMQFSIMIMHGNIAGNYM